MEDNTLYYGDNLQVLREHIPDESVDLVYLDPPFKSNQDYNVLFAERDGSRAAAQIKAFEDTWEWNLDAQAAYEEIVEVGGRVAQAMIAFHTFLGANDLMAYLAMMAPRLVELHRVLKQTGSIYLHCDPTAGHYLKILMDAIFGPHRFLNEITWKRTGAHGSAKRYGPVHDLVLYYSKTDQYRWNQQYRSQAAYIEERYTYIDERGKRFYPVTLHATGTRKGSSGQPWRGIDIAAKGGHWKYGIDTLEELDAAGHIYWPRRGGMPRLKMYAENAKGAPAQDWWDDISALNSQAQERLGYPTQKPEALLDRIILASSNEGDIVLDPFCGCGTAIASAQRLGRRWIGIDITHLAITLIKSRLRDAFGPEIQNTYEVKGEPVSVPDAVALAAQDRYQFQWWALGLAGARPIPAEQKKGADRGIDGRIYFHDDFEGAQTRQVVLSVKSGKLKAGEVRDLVGVVNRESAAIGVLLTLDKPTGKMGTEAAEAGFYESPGWRKKFPRVQILTIAELLKGKGIDMPPMRHTSTTFKRAPRAKTKKDRQAGLFTQPTPEPEEPESDTF